MAGYRARALLTEAGVLEDGVLGVEDGRITELRAGGPYDVDLGDVAVLPGLVNAHSHAFQRVLRGRAEHLLAARPEADFWTWRARMYQAALALGPDEIEAVSAMAFLEMALSGITTVGEFHYLHHDPKGAVYADPNELAHRVIAAARGVGLRIALLRVAYHRAGFDRPAEPEQRRFVEPDVYTFLGRAEALAASHKNDQMVTIGLAPHSVRAVPEGWLCAIAEHGRIRGRVVHIHACEQRAELAQCQAAHGIGPVELLARADAFAARTTLVHATHLDDAALGILATTKPVVCACPTTERNLGDGFLPASALLERGVPIALGSDGQSQIDLWEDLRLVEYHERLRHERRCVLARQHPQRATRAAWPVADVLLPMATANGATSLGLDGGVLRVGAPADFVAVGLDDPALIGATAATLPSELAFSTSPRAVRAVFARGQPIIQNGRHHDQEVIIKNFRAVMARLDAAA